MTSELSELARALKKRQPFASAAEEAYVNLLRTHSALTGRGEQVFKRHGLSGPKYNVLRILRGAAATGEAGPCGLPSLEVAARLVARVPDITRLVDSLEADGLVTRTRCTADRRVVYVGVTPAGLDRLAAVDGPLGAFHDACLGHLSAAEFVELSRLLVKARAVVEADSE